MTRLRQVALIVIAFSTGLVGIWATVAPKSFYDDLRYWYLLVKAVSAPKA